MDGAGAAGGGTGTAAPAAAPSTGAAPSAGGEGAAPSSSGAPTTAAERKAILFRPKDADREFDITEAVEQHLRSYARKVKVNGEEREVHLEDAFRAASLEPAAKKQFTEADKLRREAEGKMAQIEAAAQAMSDPTRVDIVLSKKWGKEKFEEWVLSRAERILREEKLPPHERQALEQRRAEAAAIEDRAAKIAAREAAIKRQESEAQKAANAALRQRIEAEWPPILKELGVPEGFVKDAMRSMIGAINEAKRLGIQLSEREAAQRCAADLRRKLGPVTVAQPSPEKVAAQPGRETKAPETPVQRDDGGRFKRKGPLRPGDVMARLDDIPNRRMT